MDNQTLLIVGVGLAALYLVTQQSAPAPAPIVIAAPAPAPAPDRGGIGENIGGSIGRIVDSIVSAIG